MMGIYMTLRRLLSTLEWRLLHPVPKPAVVYRKVAGGDLETNFPLVRFIVDKIALLEKQAEQALAYAFPVSPAIRRSHKGSRPGVARRSTSAGSGGPGRDRGDYPYASPTDEKRLTAYSHNG